MESPRILVAEDDAFQRKQLAGWAEQVGFEVLEAADGLAALALFDQGQPDIVISDFHMPGLDGRALVNHIRNHPQGHDVPVMIVTADGSRAAKLELLQFGADDFIRKPVDPAEFQARLASMARKSALVVNLANVTAERDDAYRELQQRARELERLTMGLVAALERASSLHDTDTGKHIQRVSLYSRLLAEAHGCDPEFAGRIYRYAGLHDVGKVGIPEKILNKPGKLTDDEMEEMKTHSLIGGELLQAAGLPEFASNIAYYHHERWDGTGYPHGLAAEEVPLEARIVSVADVLDALATRRCYKPSFSVERSFEILRESAGSQLDPALVEELLAREEEVLSILDRYGDGLDDEETWG